MKPLSRLNTEYLEYELESGEFEVSCDSYYLPDHLQAHIHYITPGIKGSDITERTSRSPTFKNSNGKKLCEKAFLSTFLAPEATATDAVSSIFVKELTKSRHPTEASSSIHKPDKLGAL